MTPWLLLRGLGRETRHWGELPQMLASASGAPVISFDLPGNGSRWRERSPTDVAAMADFCHEQLARQGIAGPCRVLAMSLGAMVTVAWAQRHPSDLAAIVLVSTSLRPFSPFHHRLRPANYGTMARLLLTRPGPEEVEGAVLDMTSTLAARSPRRDGILRDWCAWRGEHPVSAANILRQLWAAAAFRAPPRPPPPPMLLLAGRGDQLVDCRCSAALAAAWDVPLALHPDAGHDLPLDDADWMLRQILDWGGASRSG